MQLNNLDVIILIIVLISGLIALSRGLIREVLSIIGWVLATLAVVFLLPVAHPLARQYISGDFMSGVVAALAILIIFFVIWIFISASIVGKIRSSKLSSMDRVLGLFFGIMRAFLLVVLLYILIGWITPPQEQPAFFKESKYFQLAGNFAEPIEKLIPQETLKAINEKTAAALTPKKQKEDKKKDKENKEKVSEDIADDLFKKLAQPKIKSKKTEEKKATKERVKGYDKNEQKSLDRLIEAIE